jgi:uncharacterized protein
VRSIDRASWREQPWKNAGGTTLEIARWPSWSNGAIAIDHPVAIDASDYDVRVSLAEITTSGPFSTFPGYRRHTFLVGPAPIRLGDVELVAPGDHMELPGEAAIEATLTAGPTQLLNVLVRASLPVMVGRGHTAHPVRFTFDLETKLAHTSDSAEMIDARECVWIA